MKIAQRLGFSLALIALSAGSAGAQIPPTPYVAPTPHLNPSSSLVVPQPREVPVSPSLSSGPGSHVFGTSGYLRGTSQVVNPPRSVLHAHHYHRHWHAQRQDHDPIKLNRIMV